MKKITLFLTIFIQGIAAQLSQAQTEKASDNVKAWKITNCVVPFDTNAKGETFKIKWGLDTAWDDETNIKRGIAFIGKDYIELARASFNPNFDLTTDGELSTSHKGKLNSRIKHIGLIGNHVEILLNDDPGGEQGLVKDMYKKDPKNWAILFDKTTEFIQNKGYKVTSIAPYNEPDYGWGQGTKEDFLSICKAVRNGEFPRLDTIRLCGGNTLNCDKAKEWYNYLKDYLEEGNTHQLAGSFASYANFFSQLKNENKIATADELHNIVEALVGAQYGMTQGIWWGFDGLARGELCRASFGQRLAYAEDRSNWTAGAVYRNTLDNKYEAFVGTSERQANKSSYLFVCQNQDVFFDGYGPQREFLIQTPGGKNYQKDQKNAERVINITFGEDVQPAPINGTYILMNKASKLAMQPSNGSVSDGTSIVQAKSSGKNYQQWQIAPIDSAHGGDFSYFTIKNVASKKDIDIWNWSLGNGGEAKLFNGGEGNNELYWFEYAGDGYYYIHSKHSNLVLGTSSTSANSTIVQQAKSTIATNQKRQLWRLILPDAECEQIAPSAPKGVKALSNSASIALKWDSNTEEDLYGYTILRAEKATQIWNTIARGIKGTQFIDNLCEQGKEYLYKVKAIDKSFNTSEASETITASTTAEKAMILQLQFDKTLADATENELDCKTNNTPSYTSIQSLVKSGTNALTFDGKNYVQLPYSVGNMPEMTICGWFYAKSSNDNGCRFFDFGNGLEQYMYFTPNNGSEAEFAIRNGDKIESLKISKISTSGWHHIAITISENKIAIYVDGNLKGESSDISIRPSDIKPVMCYLGRSQNQSARLLNGYIDDLRIYNYPLSSSEISDIINDNQTSIQAPTSNVQNDNIYTIEGIKVSNNAIHKKGIYIHKNKKVLLK